MKEAITENRELSEWIREIEQLYLDRGFIKDGSAAVSPGDRAVKNDGWTVRIIPHYPDTNGVSLAFYKSMEAPRINLRDRLMMILGKTNNISEKTSQEPPIEILESTGKFKCRSERRTGFGNYYEVDVTDSKN